MTNNNDPTTNSVILSIIIPIYNIENYIRDCIDSILTQVDKHTDIEIILIDDGSNDASGKICDSYISNRFIHVAHQRNQGVSVARNKGLSLSHGKYIYFVDGDDVLAPNALRLILDKIIDSQADLITGSCIKFSKKIPNINKNTIDRRIVDSLGRDNATNDIVALMKHNLFLPSMWNVICASSLFSENGILFENRLTNNEDVDCAMQLFTAASKIALLDRPHYYYRQSRAGSATSTFTKERILSTLVFIDLWMNKSRLENVDESLLPWIKDYLLYQLNIAEASIYLIPNEDKKMLKVRLLDYNVLYESRITRKNIYVSYVRKYFGNSFAAYSMSRYLIINQKLNFILK